MNARGPLVLFVKATQLSLFGEGASAAGRVKEHDRSLPSGKVAHVSEHASGKAAKTAVHMAKMAEHQRLSEAHRKAGIDLALAGDSKGAKAHRAAYMAHSVADNAHDTVVRYGKGSKAAHAASEEAARVSAQAPALPAAEPARKDA